MTPPDVLIAAARSDPSLAVLEGFHALKHAVRFGATIELAVTANVRAVVALCSELAPDVSESLISLLREIDEPSFARCAPRPPATGVVTVAVRPAVDIPAALGSAGTAVLLEDPRHHGNVGAVIRAAAALGAAAVLTTGDLDVWHAAALRGSAGLHYALPVATVKGIPDTTRPIVAFHPEGDSLSRGIPANALLCLGSERSGLSKAVLSRADYTVAIPMREGVSSLNLATAAAIALFAATTD